MYKDRGGISMIDFHMCPKFETAFEILGKRWTGLIIQALISGCSHFSQISNMIPQMSDRMLVERLKELETEGIIERQVFSETPVRIEYKLTKKGFDLKNVMDSVQLWADKWVVKENTSVES